MSSQLQYLLIGACILGFAAMEFITRRYQATVRDNATANDAWLEVLMFVSLIAITQPIALLGSNALCNWLMPAQHNAWANLPWWAMAGLLLIGDDLTQYLWHRASHTPLLWPSLAVHHSATEMTWLAIFRFHPINRLTTTIIDSAFILSMGLPAYAVLVSALFRHYYGAFIHADLPWTFGPLRHIFVSPAMTPLPPSLPVVTFTGPGPVPEP